MENLIREAESHLLHTYNRYQVVLDRGEGVYLYDVNGKKYLDFFSGIGVFSLGYHYPGYDEALKAQIDKLLHTSNYYYNEPAIKAADLLTKAACMDRVFFTNSGAEAVEGALKAAVKYGFLKDGRHDHEIIALEHSFHGRTMGALSVTGNEKYREPFEPLCGNIRFGRMNDIDSIKALITDRTCGIIMETVQGEGGIHPAKKEFLQQVRDICNEKDILLILDEIQCGMGRSGEYFAWQKLGVKPDIMTVAKAVGGGVPVGAFLMSQKVADNSLVAGDHGTTYGGNPFGGAAITKMLSIYEEDGILAHVNEITPYLESKLDGVLANHDFVIARRGLGLLQGLEFDRPVANVISAAIENGMILINAGADIIRFIPPLIIKKEHVDEMIDKLEMSLDKAFGN